jgi:hypothetical protein
MSNVPVSGSYPAVEFQPSETNSVFHTDQEFTDSNSNSHMFRTYNAQYTAPFWNTLTSGVSDAYATVQNPDGSIHYYWNGGVNQWTAWQGSGNNAVYNAVDYGLVAGSVSPSQQQANVTAIGNAVSAAINGGTVVIPAGTYELSGTISVSGVTGGIVIRGESAGTILVQQGVAAGETMQAVDTFDVSNAGNPGQYGVRFRDLTISYPSGLTITSSGAVAINCVSGVESLTVEYCGFDNCPQAFAAGSSGSATFCGLVCCTIFQTGYPGSTQVWLSGPECFTIDCNIYQTPMPTHDGPTGCTGILVGNGAVACQISGCHLADFSTGITIGGGDYAQFTKISDCEINCATALNIVPPTNAGLIYGVYVSDCSFAMIQGYTAPSPTSGAYIDTNGGGNTNVEGIFFVNCLAYGYQNAGLQVDRGQAVTVIGGKYSSNGTGPASTGDGAGIAITGTCNQVRIVGADCSGVFDFWGTTQPYGVAVLTGRLTS